jgi:hypothetical protein
MGILFPNEAVARRWDGALQARLTRAPLEAFLRAHSVAPAPVGVAQDSDNLVRATVLIVEASLLHYFKDRDAHLAPGQRARVGHTACLVSRTLSALICQPGAWRIGALISTARLLSPWIGLNVAAMASALYARQFKKQFKEPPCSQDARIMDAVRGAVNLNGADTMAELTASIAALLNADLSPPPQESAEVHSAI